MAKATSSYFFHQPAVPIIGFVAPSGSGKTTLIEKIIPALVELKVRVAIIKHSHHCIEFDKPGKDSYRFSQAGAQQMLLDTPNQWVLKNAKPLATNETKLNILVQQLDLTQLDLIIVEGFKHEPFDKIEIFRKSYNETPLALDDPNIIAICTDSEEFHQSNIKLLNLNHINSIVDFIIKHTNLPHYLLKQKTNYDQ